MEQEPLSSFYGGDLNDVLRKFVDGLSPKLLEAAQNTVLDPSPSPLPSFPQVHTNSQYTHGSAFDDSVNLTSQIVNDNEEPDALGKVPLDMTLVSAVLPHFNRLDEELAGSYKLEVCIFHTIH